MNQMTASYEIIPQLWEPFCKFFGADWHLSVRNDSITYLDIEKR